MNEPKLRAELNELNTIFLKIMEIIFQQNENNNNLDDLLWEYKTRRAELQLTLTRDNKIPVIVDPVLRNELTLFLKHGNKFMSSFKKKSRDGDIVKSLEKMLEPEFDNTRLKEVVDQEFLEWFNQYEYVYALINTATIVVKTNELPEKLHQLINELRQCIIFQNYLAAGIMLRTIIDVAVKDILSKNFPEVIFKTLGEKLDYLETKSAFGIPASILNAYRKDLNDYVHGNKLADSKFIKQYVEIVLDQVKELYEKSV